jgi:hypothetical protein
VRTRRRLRLQARGIPRATWTTAVPSNSSGEPASVAERESGQAKRKVGESRDSMQAMDSGDSGAPSATVNARCSTVTDPWVETRCSSTRRSDPGSRGDRQGGAASTRSPIALTRVERRREARRSSSTNLSRSETSTSTAGPAEVGRAREGRPPVSPSGAAYAGLGVPPAVGAGRAPVVRAVATCELPGSSSRRWRRRAAQERRTIASPCYFQSSDGSLL